MEDLFAELKNLKSTEQPLLESNRQSQSLQLMPQFLEKQNTLQLKLQVLNNINDEIAKHSNLIQQAASIPQEKDSMKRVEQLQQQSTKQVVEVKKLFESLELMGKEADPNEPESRTMEYNLKSLKSEVATLLTNSQETIKQYNKVIEGKMRRQLEILKPEWSDEQKNEIISDPQGLEKLIMKETLGQPSLQVVHRVEDIQEKYRDILKLEKSTQHCFQMLQEIALLVNQQGQELETIELNLNKAQNYVKKGEKKLADEKKIHQKSRKKMCCIILIGLIALGVIATPIILKFVNVS